MIRRLCAKGIGYWLISFAILAATILGHSVIDQRLKLDDLKNAMFMLLTRSTTNPAIPRNVKLIAIGDQEFWGPMRHRSPSNRAYLAGLIRAADAADASVIALDFDLRLGGRASGVKAGDYRPVEEEYRAETDTLIRAIGDVAQRRRIVLVKTIDGPVNGPFVLQADIYQAYGICSGLRAEGRWDNPGTRDFPLTPAAQRNISCGYIALMDDLRQVPPAAHLVGQTARLDSFAMAIARARDPAAPVRLGDGDYYASYIPEAALTARSVTVPAAALLADPAAERAVLQGYPIIGAAWHLRAPGEGEMADVHDTPIGQVVGSLIHANLTEAVLSGRTYPALPAWVMLLVEAMLGIAAAVMFALIPSPLLATAVLVAAMPVLLAVQWLSLQLFGTFLDLFAPVIGLGIHAITDRLIGGGHAPTPSTPD